MARPIRLETVMTIKSDDLTADSDYLVTISVSGVATSSTRTEVAIRNLSTVIDEPIVRGGTNEGASPTEMLLASLAGATTIVANRIAKNIGVDIEDLAIRVEGEFDRRGVTLRRRVHTPFPEIRLTIRLVTDAHESLITRLQKDLDRYCPITSIFRESGVRLTTKWKIQTP